MTILRRIPVDGRWYIDGRCDSSEAKPSGNIAEGSEFLETDTGNFYLYNVKTETWVLQFCMQG